MSFGPKPWKDAPDATTPLSAAALIDLEARLAGYTDLRTPAFVTTLPASPADGECVEYQPDPVNLPEVTWQLVYRAARNGGAGAWGFAGGAGWRRIQGTGGNQATASIGTTVAMTDGPSIMVPHAGVWRVEAGGSVQALNAAATQSVVYVAVDGAATAAVGSTYSNDGAFEMVGTFQTVRVTTSGAATLSLRVGTNGQTVRFGEYIKYVLAVTPVEVRP